MKFCKTLVIAGVLFPLPLAAQIATPARPVTDPATLTSQANPAARPVPLSDISTSRRLYGATWSADGKYVFVATDLTGRANIWRTDTAGSWPVQMTQSDDAQGGLAASSDGKFLYFQQDRGGNEYYDIYRVPTTGGAVEQVTNTPDIAESDMVVSPQTSLIALSTKSKAQGQSNLAVLDNGIVRVLTNEADPQFSWNPVAWIEGGKALIAVRADVGRSVAETYRVDVTTGVAVLLLGKTKTRYITADVTSDGRLLAVTTNDGTAQLRAGIYDTLAKSWRWLAPTPWEQQASAFVDNGASMIVRTNEDGRSILTRFDLAGGTQTPLALNPGLNQLVGNDPVFSNGSIVIASHSGADSPANLFVVDTKLNSARPVTQLAIASLTPDQLPKSKIVTYKSFDGTLISAVVTMPFNLLRDGTNPAIVMPHGGPTAQTQDGYSATATALASRGYVVIQPNFRGSTGYGEAFQNANFQDLGGGDLKDTVAAKQFLVASGYVDATRVGITGGSYGGFMTLMAIGRVPNEFAAAVQQFGIINWRTMYRDQDERLKAYQRSLLGTPDSAPRVYDSSSPLTYLNAAKAPLLTLQGENDIRVPRGQAQEVHDLLTAKGNIVETIYYPAEGHGFRKRENQIDSLSRLVAWFDRFLKAPK
jgi:dipeptidyl aminopeptidase/acylaminoacyl peptidase